MNGEWIKDCLHCKRARCQMHCPIATPIPTVIDLVQNGQAEAAAALLFENNPLSAICAMVCDHEDQCYGHCIRGIKGDAVPFYRLEQVLSRSFLDTHTVECPQPNGCSAAIVGGGPAGMVAAMLLAQKGVAVTMFDENSRLGGVLRYGIPDFRLAKDVLDRYEEMLVSLGVRFRYHCRIGTTISLSTLRQEYDAVLLASGAGQANPLRIPGEALGHVHYAIDYLKSPASYHLGKRVLVLGAGNVAMDAARTAARRGHTTSIYYRKSFAEMKANREEIEDTKRDGVDFVLFQSPVTITEEGVVFADSENVTDENGRIVTKILEHTEHLVPCDAIIVAVSQHVDNIGWQGSGLAETGWHTPETDAMGRTSLLYVYAAGDARSGAKTVVHAAASAKAAVEAMLQDLSHKQ